jgi:hypothetical protein
MLSAEEVNRNYFRESMPAVVEGRVQFGGFVW